MQVSVTQMNWIIPHTDDKHVNVHRDISMTAETLAVWEGSIDEEVRELDRLKDQNAAVSVSLGWDKAATKLH